ncbi:MAG TPA: class I SAM-dependent methyltransferase, partial [Acidobacteriota bacterium]|nr:class I SAM-dependent methyltransferase [Acidobacteriota bacterium]
MITRPPSKDGFSRSRLGLGLAAALVLASLVAAWPGEAQTRAVSDDAVWSDFMAWFKSLPSGPPPQLNAYVAKLIKDGLSKEEAGRRIALILKLFSERPEGPEVFYDRAYARPTTGDPPTDGYASVPSEFLIESLKGLKPGAALDVGAGQGRNAVWLATQGWDVTGIDISGVGLAAAAANAAKAGVSIRTIKTAYADYDFGTAKWDLVAMFFAWAPVTDPGFMARIEQALRPGGLVVFEHFVKDDEHPYPPMVRALSPGDLRKIF